MQFARINSAIKIAGYHYAEIAHALIHISHIHTHTHIRTYCNVILSVRVFLAFLGCGRTDAREDRIVRLSRIWRSPLKFHGRLSVLAGSLPAEC